MILSFQKTGREYHFLFLKIIKGEIKMSEFKKFDNSGYHAPAPEDDGTLKQEGEPAGWQADGTWKPIDEQRKLVAQQLEARDLPRNETGLIDPFVFDDPSEKEYFPVPELTPKGLIEPIEFFDDYISKKAGEINIPPKDYALGTYSTSPVSYPGEVRNIPCRFCDPRLNDPYYLSFKQSQKYIMELNRVIQAQEMQNNFDGQTPQKQNRRRNGVVADRGDKLVLIYENGEELFLSNFAVSVRKAVKKLSKECKAQLIELVVNCAGKSYRLEVSTDKIQDIVQLILKRIPPAYVNDDLPKAAAYIATSAKKIRFCILGVDLLQNRMGKTKRKYGLRARWGITSCCRNSLSNR